MGKLALWNILWHLVEKQTVEDNDINKAEQERNMAYISMNSVRFHEWLLWVGSLYNLEIGTLFSGRCLEKRL